MAFSCPRLLPSHCYSYNGIRFFCANKKYHRFLISYVEMKMISWQFDDCQQEELAGLT
jgi:hypothetical protein